MKSFIIYLSVVALIVGAFIINGVEANSTFTLPALSARANSVVTVGPDVNVQVLATTSDRAYAYFATESGASAVYCNGNGDQYANSSTAVTFKLSTTTGHVHEIHLEKNPYNGAVRCTAAATTTIIVSEYKVKNSY